MHRCAGASLWLLLLAGCPSNNSATPDAARAQDAKPSADAPAPLHGRVELKVGTAGGTLKSADGLVTLQIPAGALEKDLTLTIEPAKNAPPGAIGTAYEVGPDGTSFKVPVLLSFTYDPAKVSLAADEVVLPAMAVDGRWEALYWANLEPDQKKVTGLTHHLCGVSLTAFKLPAQGPAKLCKGCEAGSCMRACCGRDPFHTFTPLGDGCACYFSESASKNQAFIPGQISCWEECSGLQYHPCNQCLRDCVAKAPPLTNPFGPPLVPWMLHAGTCPDTCVVRYADDCARKCGYLDAKGLPANPQPRPKDKNPCCGVTCGDGLCHSSESVYTCPADCPQRATRRDGGGAKLDAGARDAQADAGPCGPKTCAGCCDSAGKCQAPDYSGLSGCAFYGTCLCGEGGQACFTCPKWDMCLPGRTPGAPVYCGQAG